jgi:hypothetical protein
MDCDSSSHRRQYAEDLVCFEVLDIESAGQVSYPQSRRDLVHRHGLFEVGKITQQRFRSWR